MPRNFGFSGLFGVGTRVAIVRCMTKPSDIETPSINRMHRTAAVAAIETLAHSEADAGHVEHAWYLRGLADAMDCDGRGEAEAERIYRAARNEAADPNSYVRGWNCYRWGH